MEFRVWLLDFGADLCSNFRFNIYIYRFFGFVLISNLSFEESPMGD